MKLKKWITRREKLKTVVQNKQEKKLRQKKVLEREDSEENKN